MVIQTRQIPLFYGAIKVAVTKFEIPGKDIDGTDDSAINRIPNAINGGVIRLHKNRARSNCNWYKANNVGPNTDP